MTLMADIYCEWCGSPATVRQADIDRGWGRFCSKSCKAVYQSNKKSNSAYNSSGDRSSDYLGGKIFNQHSNVFK